MNQEKFDVVIIGSGPGGYVCAIRCAQLGFKTAIIEKNPTLGGTCLNIGCIPSKALLDSTEKFYQIRHSFKEHGIIVSDVKVDLSQMMKRKEQVVKELTDGVRFLMNKNKIEVLHGVGSIHSHSEEQIQILVQNEQPQVLTTKNCIIATGSTSILPKDIGIPVDVDGEHILISDHALSLKEIPESMLVIGGGVIGLELGSVWNRLGTKVTIVEILPDILLGLDSKMRQVAKNAFTKQGMRFLLNHKLKEIIIKNNRVISKIETPTNEIIEIETEKVLFAIGRKPYTEGLNLEAFGIEKNERGRIKVNQHYETNRKGIFAIGDVIEGPMLAHKAEEEGIAVANYIANKYSHVNYDLCPYVIYTWPEIAWVGKNEDQLTQEGKEFLVGTFLFRANGRAKGMGETEGQVKIVADKKTDKILGVSIIGPYASELLGEAVIAMEFGASSEDLGRSFHSHPNLIEVIKEAALDVQKEAIHK
ncbi:MAG: dihydrolipoyl dehydrogenase [Leptospiraceae bacterium]|nr:dihydrolipoyl dehydrogenase [Leptospiraceae bacterium]MDW7977073.1 dihydrolipoyl dehydrogenase [Leptospiraceae bacterium]